MNRNIRRGRGKFTASSSEIQPTFHQANVRLIAAAPDLLAACEIALADLKDGGNDDGKAGDALKAAIALVRGDAA